MPVTGDLYLTRDMKTAVTYAISPDAGMDDFRSSAPRRLQTRAPDPTALVALLSKRSGGSMQDDFLGRLTIARQQRMSSSVKFCLVARGDADLYPRFGPTSQWDTAAGHAILNAAGGCVTDLSGAPLRYGSPDVNIFNQPFVAWGRSPH